VDIYESKNFQQTGPAGCNMCGGIISESLVQVLATEGMEQLRAARAYGAPPAGGATGSSDDVLIAIALAAILIVVVVAFVFVRGRR